MSLGTAIAELKSRFDRLARSKGGDPATYGTKGQGKGQQPKRKNNPAHVAGAIAVLKALNKEVALPMQVLSRGAEVRAYLSISTRTASGGTGEPRGAGRGGQSGQRAFFTRPPFVGGHGQGG